MTHIAQAIAWTLIHFCWQAAAILGVYLLVSMAVNRRSSQTRYVLALSTLLIMMASACVTFAWEYRAATSISVPVAPAAFIAAEFPRITAPGMAATQSAATAGISLPSLLPWIDGFWILGVIILSIRSLGGWWLIHRLRESATTPASDSIRVAFERVSAALGIRRSVLLRISDAIASPMTIGALRAVVFLPVSAVTSIGPDELEVVFAHELAHICRADFFWNLMQTLAETLFFFHPGVWWISARIRHERELCCDDLALQVCPNPVVYARALYRLEEQRSREWRLAMALDGHQSPQTLRMRIARILDEPIGRRGFRPLRPMSLASGCAAIALLLLLVPQLLAGLGAAPKPPLRPATAPSPSCVQCPAVHSNAHATVALAAPHPLAEAPTAEPVPAQSGGQTAQSKPSPSAHSGGDYIDRMKAAGYDVDLDKLIAMKIQDVTPEYAQAMANVGFGKPSADELIACKVQGVTPEYIAQIKQQGLEVNSLHDAISYHIFGVTPDFAAGMKAAGFPSLTSKQLLAMRVQGVTPEYAKEIRQRFPNATADDVVKTRIFNIDAAFIAAAEKHGLTNLSLEKLVKLRISGLLDDESVKP